MAEQIRKRNEIEARYTWDLSHIYASDEAWEKAYAHVSGEVSAAAAFSGKVAEDPKGAVRAYFSLQKQLLPVYEYAFLRKETDNADPVAQGLKDRAVRLLVQAQAAMAFLEPELLGLREVPCIVVTCDELESGMLALVENLQRRDLDYIEQAQGLERLMRL